MRHFRNLTVALVFAGLLVSSSSQAGHGWMEKVVPIAGLIGGVGCAVYGYPMAGASLALSSALTFGVTYVWRACSKQNTKTPTLAEVLNQPAKEVVFDSPDEMIRYFDRAFHETTEFAVSDAKTFHDQIPDDLKQTILARAKKDIVMAKPKIAKEANFQLVGTLLSSKEKEMKPKMIHNIANNVVISKTGICSTFAPLAYEMLSSAGRDSKIPVEILARHETGEHLHATTHLFTVVGRKAGSDLANPSTWGDDARVVDLWLGALGNAYVYTAADFEHQGWLTNLSIVQSNL